MCFSIYTNSRKRKWTLWRNCHDSALSYKLEAVPVEAWRSFTDVCTSGASTRFSLQCAFVTSTRGDFVFFFWDCAKKGSTTLELWISLFLNVFTLGLFPTRKQAWLFFSLHLCSVRLLLHWCNPCVFRSGHILFVVCYSKLLYRLWTFTKWRKTKKYWNGLFLISLKKCFYLICS